MLPTHELRRQMAYWSNRVVGELHSELTEHLNEAVSETESAGQLFDRFRQPVTQKRWMSSPKTLT